MATVCAVCQGTAFDLVEGGVYVCVTCGTQRQV